jgi:prepilin-type N-terminal cleavage/methylation domain-containing protein
MRPAARIRVPDGAAGGFTLVEVVLVIVIAAVSLLPLSMLFATTSIRSGDAHNATLAAQLAEAKMEEITADKNSPTRGYAYITSAHYPGESPVPAFPGYSRSVAVAPDSVYDGVTFRTVSVTVTSSNIPPVTLTTWFTQY